MHWIDQLPFGVEGCSVIPFIARDPEGYFDCGEREPFLTKVYVSVTAVKELARETGWSSPDVIEDLRNDLEQKNLRIQELEDENTELARNAQAIDLLESAGYTARKKPGRPKTKAA